MSRAPRRRRPSPSAGDSVPGPFTADRVEEHPDGEWVVRAVTGSASSKVYRCPGCDHEIRPATPHVVAWPVGAVEDRRHWHRACWQARHRRRPSR